MNNLGFISFHLKKTAQLQNGVWKINSFNKTHPPAENVLWQSDLEEKDLWLHEIALYRHIKPLGFMPYLRFPQPKTEDELTANAQDFVHLMQFFSGENRFAGMDTNMQRLSLAIAMDRRMLTKFNQINWGTNNTKLAEQIKQSLLEPVEIESAKNLPKKKTFIHLHPVLHTLPFNTLRHPKGSLQKIDREDLVGVTANSFAVLENPFFIRIANKKIKSQYTIYRNVLDKTLMSFCGCKRVEREWFYCEEYILLNRYYDFDIIEAIAFNEWDNGQKYFPELDIKPYDDFVQEMIEVTYLKAQSEHNEMLPDQFVSGLHGVVINSWLRSKFIIPFALLLKENGFLITTLSPHGVTVVIDEQKDNTAMLKTLLNLTQEHHFKIAGV